MLTDIKSKKGEDVLLTNDDLGEIMPQLEIIL